MFLSESVRVPLPLHGVEQRFAALVRRSDIQHLSRLAHLDAIGERHDLGISTGREIDVHTTAPWSRGAATVMQLHWLSPSGADRGRDVLDANLELSPSGEDDTVIRLIGSYQLPDNGDSNTLANLHAHQIANRAARGFLDNLKHKIETEPAPPDDAATDSAAD